ncbi:hypothetical protein ACFW6R_04390 [Streptomyces albidoflavus]
MTPADTLRAAAGRLRHLVASLSETGWGNRPWHVEECSDTDDMSPCPCIVAQGEHRDFDQPQQPPVQYVADAETVEHGAYIAAMHPGVGKALADWLETAARDHEAGVTAAEDVFRDDPAGRDRFLATGPGAPSPHALTVARQILGSTA